MNEKKYLVRKNRVLMGGFKYTEDPSVIISNANISIDTAKNEDPSNVILPSLKKVIQTFNELKERSFNIQYTFEFNSNSQLYGDGIPNASQLESLYSGSGIVAKDLQNSLITLQRNPVGAAISLREGEGIVVINIDSGKFEVAGYQAGKILIDNSKNNLTGIIAAVEDRVVINENDISSLENDLNAEKAKITKNTSDIANRYTKSEVDSSIASAKTDLENKDNAQDIKITSNETRINNLESKGKLVRGYFEITGDISPINSVAADDNLVEFQIPTTDDDGVTTTWKDNDDVELKVELHGTHGDKSNFGVDVKVGATNVENVEMGTAPVSKTFSTPLSFDNNGDIDLSAYGLDQLFIDNSEITAIFDHNSKASDSTLTDYYNDNKGLEQSTNKLATWQTPFILTVKIGENHLQVRDDAGNALTGANLTDLQNYKLAKLVQVQSVGINARMDNTGKVSILRNKVSGIDFSKTKIVLVKKDITVLASSIASQQDITNERNNRLAAELNKQDKVDSSLSAAGMQTDSVVGAILENKHNTQELKNIMDGTSAPYQGNPFVNKSLDDLNEAGESLVFTGGQVGDGTNPAEREIESFDQTGKVVIFAYDNIGDSQFNGFGFLSANGKQIMVGNEKGKGGVLKEVNTSDGSIRDITFDELHDSTNKPFKRKEITSDYQSRVWTSDDLGKRIWITGNYEYAGYINKFASIGGKISITFGNSVLNKTIHYPFWESDQTNKTQLRILTIQDGGHNTSGVLDTIHKFEIEEA